ncbi:hypothetical protein [Streptomyces sp. NPDC002573]|uniref:hypothetical protein n=1 Tax=Streptomyces sp. NPDC002573 TaxID=3364651 RepID=UPI0036AB1D4C
MSDDDTPDNVRRLPRIGSPPPPPVPPRPDLDGAGGDAEPGGGHVRISAFDAPDVPRAPRASGAVPATLRSEPLNGQTPSPDAGPPRAGALSLAAILAIALAAFEGLHSWIQESGPRRAEAARHQRELELLAAKAGADAHRMGAEADAQRARSQRRIPSSHEYGRGALGRGSGGQGRLGGGHVPGGPRRDGTGPYSGSGSGSGRGGGRSGPGGTFGGRSGNGQNSGSTSRGGWGSGAGSRGGSGGGSRGGLGGGNTRAGTGGADGRNNGSTGGAGGPGGRRSPRQAVSDWLHGRKRTGKGIGSGSADTAARIRDTVRKQKTGPTFWDQVGSRAKDRWKKRQGDDSGGSATGGKGGKSGNVNGKPDTNAGDWTPPGDGERIKLKDAAYSAFRARWEKRREGWKARGGPRRTPPPREPKAPGSSRRAGSGRKRKPKNPSGSAGPGAGPRSSAFDADDDSGVTITYEQMDPPGAHAKRWEPDAITTGRQQLPRQATPVLPRAPQRPGGQRPGTTRRKDPIPMPAASPRPGAPAPVTATVPASGGMSARHATDIRLDDVLKALTVLTTAGMETHDECAELARHARRLLGELETMAHDLAENHNVNGAKTMRAVAALMESVGTLIVQAERMAKACLTAAELSEAEEQAMARDHRPMQAAYIDAGVAAPSARIHNEN